MSGSCHNRKRCAACFDLASHTSFPGIILRGSGVWERDYSDICSLVPRPHGDLDIGAGYETMTSETAQSEMTRPPAVSSIF